MNFSPVLKLILSMTGIIIKVMEEMWKFAGHLLNISDIQDVMGVMG